MSSIEVYKSGMGSGLRRFFESYEQSIKELIDNLKSDRILLKSFSNEQITRLQNLTRSSNMSLKLANDFDSLFKGDKQQILKKIKLLKKAGFKVDNPNRIAEHFLSILTNTYTTLLERLKLYLLFFIDWDKLKIQRKKIYGIGAAIDYLKSRYPTNKYLNYFDSVTRNSIVHYTFFWEVGGKIKLCSEIFDKTPKEMTLVQLMKEIKELNVLTEGFFMMLRDNYGLPEFKLEDLEK